jgi:hypothetical protein
MSAPQQLMELLEEKNYEELTRRILKVDDLVHDSHLSEIVGTRAFVSEIMHKRKILEDEMIRHLELLMWRNPLERALFIRTQRLQQLDQFKPVFKFDNANEEAFRRHAYAYVMTVYQ